MSRNSIKNWWKIFKSAFNKKVASITSEMSESEKKLAIFLLVSSIIILFLLIFFSINSVLLKPGQNGIFANSSSTPTYVALYYPTKATSYANFNSTETLLPTKIRQPTPTDTKPSFFITPTSTNINPSTIMYEEHFDNVNSLESWSSIGGSWNVSGGLCYLSQGTGYIYTGDINWKNYYFLVDIKGENVVDKIFNVRFYNTANLYEINIRSDPYNDVVLSKISTSQGGKQLSSASFNNYNNIWYTVKIYVSGFNLKVYINDQLVISYVDTQSPVISGKIGMGGIIRSGSKIYFDNVVVMSQ